MKRYVPHIIVIALLVIATITLTGHFTLAQAPAGTGGGNTNLFGLNIYDFIAEAIANTVQSLQQLASWFVALAGFLLNYSIGLTLKIHDFVNATPAIFQTWKAIRDISGMFIIFFLLYAAIQMIIGQKPGFGKLIKDIVMAGVLINFSFFVAGLGIDVSNIISVQLYNAIAPANEFNMGGLNPSNIQSTWKDGGLSDIFMKSLRVTSLYSNSNGLTSVKILLIGATSIIIMITAALSFMLAAAAFIIRFVILLFLLAFSPVLFASYVIPNVGEGNYGKDWLGVYKSMLVFMPVYLLLMYLSLSILTQSTFFTSGFTGSLAGDHWYEQLIVLGVNSWIVIFLLNVPLLAAIKIGGAATKWIDPKKFGAHAIWKGVAGFTGRNTLGAAAYSAKESQMFKSLAAKNPNLGVLANAGLSKVAKGGFLGKAGGYEGVLSADKKALEAMHKQIGEVDRSKYKTQEEFDEAEKEAKRNQKAFRSNLETSVIGKMISSRANQQSGAKLNKDAKKKEDDEAKKEKIKKADKDIKKVNTSIDITNKSIEKLKKEAGESSSDFESQKADQLRVLGEQIQNAQKQMTDPDAQIKQYQEKMEQERVKMSGVMPAARGAYQKRIDDYQSKITDIEQGKTTIADLKKTLEQAKNDIMSSPDDYTERRTAILEELKDTHARLVEQKNDLVEKKKEALSEKEFGDMTDKLSELGGKIESGDKK